MKHVGVIFLFALMHLNCVKPPVITNETRQEIDVRIDFVEARKKSDFIAHLLVEGDRIKLREQMETLAREYFDDRAFSGTVDKMFDIYGMPVSYQFWKDEIGRKTGLVGDYDKPLRKFWYYLKTTKYETGTVFLTVEIVPDGESLGSSGFAMLTFPLGTPPDAVTPVR